MVALNAIGSVVTMLVVIAAGGLVLLISWHQSRSAGRPHQGQRDESRSQDHLSR
jgi:hypothetical protein